MIRQTAQSDYENLLKFYCLGKLFTDYHETTLES